MDTHNYFLDLDQLKAKATFKIKSHATHVWCSSGYQVTNYLL